MNAIGIHPSITNPFPSFEEAVQTVLQFLHEHIGFKLWMFTRVDGDDWVILSAHDHGYNVSAGDVFRWSDSFCSRMICGLGPRIAPVANAVPAYAEAPIGRLVPIEAYIGIPVYSLNNELFGTLCAIDPEPQSSDLEQYLPLIELQSRLLTTILQAELNSQENQRKLEQAEAEAQVDSLTGIFNRRAWDRLLHLEEERCRRYGGVASIVVIDLDGLKQVNDTCGHSAGDRLIQSAAHTLQNSIRATDVLARLGGDEFSILLVETSADDAETFIHRLRDQLKNSAIHASIGWATRLHQADLHQAFETADQAMYQEKLIRKSLHTIKIGDGVELNS